MKTETEEPKFPHLTVLGAAFIVVVWFSLPVVLFNMYNNQTIPPELGIIGDMFGSVNALFAGLGLLLVVVTLRQGQRGLKMQQRELQIQHEELVESRKVLADQASAQHEMIIAIQKLATETRFSSRVHAQIALMHETDSTFMKSAEREFLVKMLRETTD